LVYNANRAAFFGGDFNQFTATVSHDPSRKRFLGKLIGLVAVVGIAPRVLTKIPGAAKPAPAGSRLMVRSDSRAVARRGDSI